jgi:AcrR family transcriptional regulator
MVSRRDNMGDTKLRLVESAVKLFERKGYLETSVQDIVEEAQLTKGSFYYYFSSKEDILFLIHDEFIEYELSKALDVVDRKDMSYSEKLKRLMFITWESIALYKEKVSIFMREMKYIEGERFKKIKEKRDRFEQCYVKVLQGGIDCGEFKPNLDPKIIAFSLMGMCGWGVHWYRSDGPLSIEEIARMHNLMILNGIGKRTE